MVSFSQPKYHQPNSPKEVRGIRGERGKKKQSSAELMEGGGRLGEAEAYMPALIYYFFFLDVSLACQGCN